MYHCNNVKMTDSLKWICNPCPIDCRSWTRRSPIRKHSKDSSWNKRSERWNERAAKTNGVGSLRRCR